MISENPSPEVDANEEISGLIETLLGAERRLEELTAGEVDTVAGRDGRTFLLRRPQEQLRQSDAVKQAGILNALPAHIALLDSQGIIISVNEAWRQFADTNVLHAPGHGVGLNYLDICDRAQGDYSAEAHQVASGVRAVLGGAEKSFSIEYPCNSPAEDRWFQLNVTPLATDHPNGVVVMHLDITAHKLADSALRESHEKFRQLAENISDVFWINSPDLQKIHYVSPAYEQIWGRSVESLYANPHEWGDAILPEERDRVYATFVGLTADRPSASAEFRIARPDGTVRWISSRGFQVKDVAGKVIRITGIASDITELKRAEEVLREVSQEKVGQRKRTAIKDVAVVFLLSFLTFGVTWYFSLLHRPLHWIVQHEELVLDEVFVGLFVALAGFVWFGWRRWHEVSEQEQVGEALRRLHDALETRIQQRTAELAGANEALRSEITERKQTGAELERTRAQFAGLVNSMDGIVWETDAASFQLTFVSERAEHILGFPAAQWLSTPHFWVNQIHPTDRQEAVGYCLNSTSKKENYTFEYRMLAADGRTVWMRDIVTYVEEPGKPAVLRGIMLDITERKRIEESLRLSEERLRAALAASRTGTFRWDIRTNELSWDESLDVLFGIPQGQAIRSLETFIATVHPDDRARVIEGCDRCAREGADFDAEFRVLWPDGSLHWLADKGKTFVDTAGEALYMTGACVDITERKKLEAQLRQGQKMEAIGTLAGGIAHDFNNILGAIMGYAELAQKRVAVGGRTHDHIEQVLNASARARDLVRQILTFGSQEDHEHEAVQLPPIIEETLTLLRAALPATIVFRKKIDPEVPRIFGDATQIQQVLMNLCVNAGHAMNERDGILNVSLTCAEIDPDFRSAHPELKAGPHVCLSVSDTGIGMDRATEERIFDPFFTTRAPGEGTGLGLAVVHGIMKGHGGAISVQSEPGVGTTFNLYLPVYDGQEATTVNQSTPAPRGNGEHILLVDDEKGPGPGLCRTGEKESNGDHSSGRR